ncbi:MAG: DUF2380 domain-containing protein [Candidatus Marinimicrobia bacterium]|nr:DUF2380 domain-containing protein [Candidatus Neomarinimicrobiota bacterium]
MVNTTLLKINLQLVLSIIFLSSAVSGQIPIAVVEFEGKNISQAEASILTDRLRNELFRLGAFQVLEREMVEQILSEQDFQLSGCTTNECLVEVGKLIGVSIIVGGSIGKVGNVFTVSARLVDVETGKLMQVTDYDYEGQIGDLLKSGMQKVAIELSNQGSPGQEVIEILGEEEKPIDKIQKKNEDLKSDAGSKLNEVDDLEWWEFILRLGPGILILILGALTIGG